MLKPALDQILAELGAREPIFRRREFGISREALLNMTADDFWELEQAARATIEASSSKTLLERYKTPEHDDWSCSNFSIHQIGEDFYQLN
ncbi:DUF4440 domain-containing protein [Rhizobium rhizogenes]|uniref:DUF4440 domain-containing protein n=1 Tax=Rhizobium rhizogenes TaxID=359 RepID=UPI001F2F9BC8|nr:DUF4440 domain-containing protein [Rhizobium rhizogenes]